MNLWISIKKRCRGDINLYHQKFALTGNPAKFKAYADSARASRAASKENLGVSVPKVVNANPFENTGIMNAVNMHVLAYLSMANASMLPELKNTDQATIDLVFKNALRGNTAEDYINRLMNPRRGNQAIQPVAKALAEQFIGDNNQTSVNLSQYELMNEYGATKCYQLTEQNSNVVFDVTFYFYGGIISGWSVEPEKGSYEQYKNGLGS